jgi:hypothetical protein
MFILILGAIFGGALLRRKAGKITAREWEKHNHNEVII